MTPNLLHNSDYKSTPVYRTRRQRAEAKLRRSWLKAQRFFVANPQRTYHLRRATREESRAPALIAARCMSGHSHIHLPVPVGFAVGNVEASESVARAIFEANWSEGRARHVYISQLPNGEIVDMHEWHARPEPELDERRLQRWRREHLH